MKSIFTQVSSITIVGAKDKVGSDVDRVGRYFIDAGLTVIPVHPVRTTVWGLKTYSSLLEIPFPVDMVNLFRTSEACFEHAQEVLQMKHHPKLFWMQLGIRNFDAKKLLETKGIIVIEDKCSMVEHATVFDRPIAPHGTLTIPSLHK